MDWKNKESQSQQAEGYSLSLKLGNNCRSKLRGITTPSLSNKKVLVTGAGGFIGSHLIEELINLGADVTAMVKSNSRHDCGLIITFKPEIRNKLKIFFGDLNDLESVRNAVINNKIIFHLGAEVSIPYSYLHPRTFVQTNLIGTFNILMACKELGIERLIHMSTSEVYGTPEKIPISETHPLKGQSPYSATKIGAEKLVESFHLSYGLPTVIIRAFNTYGPRQSARAIIPTLITQALFKERIFIGNTNPTRDFNYVSDTVKGLIKVAECQALVGEVVNIGSGKEISIEELARKIVLLTGKKCEYVLDSERVRPEKSEVMRLCSDNSKIKKFINWAPEITFEEGLKRTIEWIKENPHYYKIGEYQI